jgi:16S rRNA (guanine966-N2)-methyltransferase
MRVIAGTYRSRLLSAPRGTLVRPTSDRLRETLFNVIAPKVPGSRFADLYAGSGAVGIEAISRGAEHVWFAEKAPEAVRAIRANLASLKIAGGFALEDRGVGALLSRIATKGMALDVVFLDPPYEDENEYTGTLGFFGSERSRVLLAESAVVIAEHLKKKKLLDRFGRLERTRLLEQGDAALSFFAAE